MTPTIGRIVIYRLTAEDADRINARRDLSAAAVIALGAVVDGAHHQTHLGNPVHEGDEYPLLITRVWQAGAMPVNGQVLLDGNDTYWARSIDEGDIPGTYRWPTRDDGPPVVDIGVEPDAG